MCGSGGPPTLEQQATALDTVQVNGPRGGSRSVLVSDGPIPLEVLNSSGAKHLPSPGGVPLENFSQMGIDEVFKRIFPADVGMAQFEASTWAQIKQTIDNATNSFFQQLAALDQSAGMQGDSPAGAAPPSASGGFSGQFHDAAMNYIVSSYPTIQTISTEVGKLQNHVQTFANTIQNTQNAIVPNYFSYQSAVNNPAYQQHKAAIQYVFDRYAQQVMTSTYAPNILSIANNPATFPVATPHASSPAITPHPSGGTSVGRGGGVPVSFGAPAVTGTSAPSGSTSGSSTGASPSPTQSFGTPANTTSPAAAMSSPTSSAMDPSSLANTAAQAMSPLQSSLGQLASTAGQGAKPPPGGPGGAASKLPPGKLADSLKPGGGGGKIGGGAGAQGPMARPAGAPSSSGGMAGRTVAAGSRAGLSAVPGAAGAGAPAGGGGGGRGQHGGAQGGVHQPNKVLRRKKNGEEIVGDAQAVVPVLGEPAHPEAAKPDAT